MKKKSPQHLDAADRSFFQELFSSITEEMGLTLMRTAFSPNIKERKDFSCALFSSQGQLVAQAAHIPIHLGALPACMQAVLKTFEVLGEGDVVILNDPYSGGTHLPDITTISPVYAHRAKKPMAYLVTRAHHADVGGSAAGSIPLAKSIFEEGFRFPPLKLIEKGVLNESLLSVFLSNVRTPIERQGDMHAQLATHRLGEKRLLEYVEQYGAAYLTSCMEHLLDYGEALMQSILGKIPNGVYKAVDYLDNDGLDEAPLKIALSLTVKGKSVLADFKGTDPACRGV